MNVTSFELVFVVARYAHLVKTLLKMGTMKRKGSGCDVPPLNIPPVPTLNRVMSFEPQLEATKYAPSIASP